MKQLADQLLFWFGFFCSKFELQIILYDVIETHVSQKGIFWYVFHISSSYFPVPSFWSLLVIAADQYIDF